MQRLKTLGDGCVLDERYVITKLHAEAAGGFDARVCDHSDENNLLDTVLLQLCIKVSLCETALSPMLVNDHITGLRTKLCMPFATRAPSGERLRLVRSDLDTVHTLPLIVIATHRTMSTVLKYQTVGTVPYIDAAGFPDRTVGL